MGGGRLGGVLLLLAVLLLVPLVEGRRRKHHKGEVGLLRDSKGPLVHNRGEEKEEKEKEKWWAWGVQKPSAVQRRHHVAPPVPTNSVQRTKAKEKRRRRGRSRNKHKAIHSDWVGSDEYKTDAHTGHARQWIGTGGYYGVHEGGKLVNGLSVWRKKEAHRARRRWLRQWKRFLRQRRREKAVKEERDLGVCKVDEKDTEKDTKKDTEEKKERQVEEHAEMAKGVVRTGTPRDSCPTPWIGIGGYYGPGAGEEPPGGKGPGPIFGAPPLRDWDYENEYELFPGEIWTSWSFWEFPSTFMRVAPRRFVEHTWPKCVSWCDERLWPKLDALLDEHVYEPLMSDCLEMLTPQWVGVFTVVADDYLEDYLTLTVHDHVTTWATPVITKTITQHVGFTILNMVTSTLTYDLTQELSPRLHRSLLDKVFMNDVYPSHFHSWWKYAKCYYAWFQCTVINAGKNCKIPAWCEKQWDVPKTFPSRLFGDTGQPL